MDVDQDSKAAANSGEVAGSVDLREKMKGALTYHQRREFGRAARQKAPRGSHAASDPSPHRPDPVDRLEAQAKDRQPDLIRIRHERMMSSPFTFMRGAAMVMARDLAEAPHTDIQAQLCGDRHLLTFGTYTSPERTLLSDVNDFDDTLPGPPGSGTSSASPQAWSWRDGRTISPTPTAERRRVQRGVQLRRRPLPLETLGGLLGQGKDYETS